MLISVGSASNDAEGSRGAPGGPATALGASSGNEDRRAAVLAFDPDGTNPKIFATGIRNCVGLAIHPDSGDAYCSTNERDGFGDDLVPDYVTRVREGGRGATWVIMRTRAGRGRGRTYPARSRRRMSPCSRILPLSA